MSIRPQTTLIGLAVVAMTFLVAPVQADENKENPRLQNRSSQDNRHTGKSSRYGDQLNRMKEQNRSSSSSNSSSRTQSSSRQSRPTPTTSSNSRTSRPTPSSSTINRTSRTTTSTYSGNRGSSSSRGTTPTVNRTSRTTPTTSSNSRTSRPTPITSTNNRPSRTNPTVSTPSRGSGSTSSTGSINRSGRSQTTTYTGNRGSSSSRVTVPTVNRSGSSTGSLDRSQSNRGSTTPTVNRGSRDQRGSGSGSHGGSTYGSHDRGGSSNKDSPNRGSGSGHDRDKDGHGRDDDRHDSYDRDKDYRYSNHDRYNSPYRRYGSSHYNNFYHNRYSRRYSSPSIHTSIILGAAAITGGSRVLSSDRRDDAIGYAVFYEHGSFRGESLEVYSGEGVFDLKDIRLDYSESFNDQISSIKVYGRLTVVLHVDAGYLGERIYIHGDIIDFSRIIELREFNDRISSIEVIPGIVDEHNYSPVRGSEYAVYGEPVASSDGLYAAEPTPIYDTPEAVRASAPLPTPLPSAASQRISSPRVHLFDQPGFRGNQIVLTPGYSEVDLSQINKGLSGNWNDGIASIKVEGGAEVFIYTDPQFLGQAIALTSNVENLAVESDLSAFYGTISSVVVNAAP